MMAVRIDFFTQVFLRRMERWMYLQLRGLTRSDVGVVAEAGQHLGEFPLDRRFLVYTDSRDVRRTLRYWHRRLSRRRPWPRLPQYSVRRIEEHWRMDPPQLVYCNFAWNAIRLLEMQSIRSIPIVFMAGGSDITAASAFGAAYERRLQETFSRARLILATSDFIRQKLLTMGASPDRVKRHYIGVEIPEWVERRSAADDRVRILAVSGLVEVKGVRFTIEAFARAVHRVPTAVLEIIGDGPDRRPCEALARRLGVADRIRFSGEQPASAVHAAMQDADLFVQHSVRTRTGHEEALGLVFLEAAARATPVVATRSGGIPEVVVDGETGILVEERDVAAMADAIVRLAGDAELRRSYGENGRRHVREIFDIDTQNRLLEDTLIAVAKG